MGIRRCLGMLVVLACAFGCGCTGYVHGFPPPPGVTKVAIEIFKNKTLYTDVEFEFTEALQHELSAKTPLEIVSRDEADAVVRGAILDYRRTILRESRKDEVEEYAIVLVVSYELVRLPTQGEPEQVIASAKELRRSGTVLVRSAFDESKVREEVFRRLAGKVVSHMFEKW